MKRNLVAIRFGVTHPLPKEVKMVAQRVVDQEDAELATGAPFHDIGVVSIFRTHLTPKELSTLFAELAAETGDVLPVIVFDLDSDATGVHFGEVPGFREAVRAFQQKLSEKGGDIDPEPKVQVLMSLDDLLDLANRKGGIDQLTTDEKRLLEKLSKDL